jgi:NAD(P)-dependent dehydrogenase (short-subunit alcohol dehydrogenase family)
LNLSGKTVVITGAASGIGRALALRCAEAGARLAISDLDARSLGVVADELGDPHTAVPADAGSPQQMEELVRTVGARLGSIDVFCANAGVAVGGDPITTPDEVWERALTVNVRAHVIAARLLLPAWLERGEGYFVSTASAAGLLTQIGSAPYSVTKHAALAFAEWLSVTYGHRGIRVSCVCPMGVNTAMLEGNGEGALDDVGRRVVRSAGAVVEPEEVAERVVAAIDEERFLVLPHPEVLTFFQRKAGDYERWLAGMRRLQARLEE